MNYVLIGTANQQGPRCLHEYASRTKEGSWCPICGEPSTPLTGGEYLLKLVLEVLPWAEPLSFTTNACAFVLNEGINVNLLLHFRRRGGTSLVMVERWEGLTARVWKIDEEVKLLKTGEISLQIQENGVVQSQPTESVECEVPQELGWSVDLSQEVGWSVDLEDEEDYADCDDDDDDDDDYYDGW